MKNWILKAIIQKLISFLPNGHKINYWFQKNITKGVLLNDEYFFEKLESLKDHSRLKEKYLENPNPVCLELGTGWYPIVPIGLYLTGAPKIYTLDLSSLLKKKNVLGTIAKFLEHQNSGNLKKYGLNILNERVENLVSILKLSSDKDLVEILTELKVTYLVGDASKLELSPSTVDFIVSNNTFEHIHENALKSILKEFKRILKPNGLMSHFIDMSDHFAHLDKSITIYNFLRFSDFWWKVIDNDIQPQNRLRIIHYRNLYKELAIPIREEVNREGDYGLLKQVKLDKKYSGISQADIAVSHSLFVS